METQKKFLNDADLLSTPKKLIKLVGKKIFAFCSKIPFLIYLQSNLCKTLLSKRLKIGFQDQLLLNAGQKYCRMLQGEHSTILLTFIKLPFVIKILVLSIFELLFYKGFTVVSFFQGYTYMKYFQVEEYCKYNIRVYFLF